MKKSHIIFYILFLLSTGLQAQSDSTFKLIKTITGDIVDFTVDNLDNVYMINSRNQLKKINDKGDSIGVFNDVKQFGEATLIDVSNPLKVLLYYKDFATIVMLDRFLNIRNTIDLRKKNIFQVRAIGQSYDNKIWLYDELDNKLKKIDEDGKLIQETPDFRLLLGQSPTPIQIFDENKFVYLYDSLQGIYVFDYYGALKNNIMITQWNNLKVAGKYIFGSHNDTLYRYELNTFQYDEWKMPDIIYRSKEFNFTTNRIYSLNSNGISIYAIKQ